MAVDYWRCRELNVGDVELSANVRRTAVTEEQPWPVQSTQGDRYLDHSFKHATRSKFQQRHCYSTSDPVLHHLSRQARLPDDVYSKN